MARFLIDANLPYRFSVWQGQDYLHVFDLSDTWPDSEIWRYAREQELTIVTKDADFSSLAILNEPPPWVIHFRIGNMKIRDLHAFLQRVWPDISAFGATHKLVNVYSDRIETIE
ncbi:MAG: DUF5615 family PIN-like protein [Gammaproteobacteria bacterium]